MKKPTFKRFALGLLQHIIAAGILVAIAGIRFNSYLVAESMKESHTYWFSPLDTEPEFEDSAVFHDMVRTAASDVVEYVAVKGLMETAGEFDAAKKVNIARYADRSAGGAWDNAGAVYELEDLIKWGRHGMEYTNRAMGISDFVNYFGPAASVENFALDENGQLYFEGFFDSGFTPAIRRPDGEAGAKRSRHSDEEKSRLEQAMRQYSAGQLEDMAFSYIMAGQDGEINVSREDDGHFTIYISMLSCKYDTVDGEKQLTAYAGNWPDYMKLQKCLEDAVTTLSEAYEVYQKGQELYEEGQGNFKFAIRMRDEMGIQHTYTNLSEVKKLSDSDLTEYFSEYRRYLVCYLENLEFNSNTRLTELDIYGYVNQYGDTYPEQSHIWMAVDTQYAVQGDVFYDANAVFNRIVPNIYKLLAAILTLGLFWLCIAGYLFVTAGFAYQADGARICYLNAFDHVWTECVLVLAAAFLYAGKWGVSMLGNVANTVYSSHSELLGMSGTKLYEYGTYGAFGALASMGCSIVLFSMVRRIRAGSMVQGSFCLWFLRCARKGISFLSSHRNMAVNTLIPYNLFLLFNMLAVIGGMYMKDSGGLRVAILVFGVVLADGLIGVRLFKQNTERMDIIDGIRRIRDGEVDYKLNLDSLSGTSRELADAVNNIGEGIRKAVDTSMKDEQMKSDLITNVSHDIKTPLTSIINYVDLLKRLKIEDEPAKGYIEILDGKAQRLKQLTDDLLEASKISSGNIILNREKLNLTELLKQTIGEFSERLEERMLQMVFEDDGIPAHIYADSRRMWRIMENLFYNICKYAMENTRVHLTLSVEAETVRISIKNISRQPMNLRGEELTERFIRGDASRTTEGSGLGLFIAKSLTQAQGGAFEIQLDGDLFKVILSFPEYREGSS